jgi:hypothetical protein
MAAHGHVSLSDGTCRESNGITEISDMLDLFRQVRTIHEDEPSIIEMENDLKIVKVL